jgi:hypothetical protein
MFKFLIFVSLLIDVSCNWKSSNSSTIDNHIAMSDTTGKELRLNIRYKAFDTTIEVLFSNTPALLSVLEFS